jgi:hypothetical protein
MPTNNFLSDPSWVLVSRFKNGALTLDTSGKGNTLTNSGVVYNAGADFERGSSAFMSRLDSDLSADFPGKLGSTNKDLAVWGHFKLKSLPGASELYVLAAKWDYLSGKIPWMLGYYNNAGTRSLLLLLGFDDGTNSETIGLYTGDLPTADACKVLLSFNNTTKAYYAKIVNGTTGAVIGETSPGTTTHNMSVGSDAFLIGGRYASGAIEACADVIFYELAIANTPKTEANCDALVAGTYGAMQIGDIPVPAIDFNGVFPIISDYGYGLALQPQVVTHRFGSANAKIEQRFYLGPSAKKFTVRRAAMRETDRVALRDFWEARNGPYEPFVYNAPGDDGNGVEQIVCRFANEPLSWEFISDQACSIGLTLIEVPFTNPSYAIASTDTRFPAATLEAALLSQVQELIPLVKIQPRETGYPAIYVSDRLCTVGGQLYLPRLLRPPENISQGISGESDQAEFAFGNADRVMRDLANDTDLNRAAIEFSLYHVGTGIKLDLWKGEINGWSFDTGPEFNVSASDGIYELTLPYPTRKISRTCWKCFDDAAGCPFTAQSTGMDTVHFPTADETICDKGYDTANGCLAHGMKRYFGGMIAEPQGVRVKDNSTGVWGFGRSSITSTSIVSDSIYDQVIPEIYTDTDAWIDEKGAYQVGMPVNCKIAAGREEGDFYAALGIVGEGPVEFTTQNETKTIKLFNVEVQYQFPNAPTQLLDGQHNHGYPGVGGLRYAGGVDPANTGDYFSIGAIGSAAANWREASDGTSVWKDNFAAGVAFLEIKRSDEKGIQLSYPVDHQMVANVLNGLQGWVWTAPGSRTLQVLTNPVWIVINMLLRARGLRYANAATAEQYFDVTAAIAAAAICDDVVDPLVGTEDETQFRFRGVLQEEKPLRDWIQEVSMNCLAYFTFVFGKMKVGIRVNSSVVEAFTEGNIIFDSLRISASRPAFNHLTANFADREFNFAANSVTVYDIDHAKLIGGATAPQFLKSNVNLAGTCTKSQAARIVTTRLREELGGITAEQWKASRNIAFKTTVLALKAEAGMVCSMTHPDMPDGVFNEVPQSEYGEFRITGWRLNSDYSLDIEGRTTVNEMYDLVEGPKPADVAASAIPTELTQLPFGLVWHPDEVAPISGDPIYGADEKTFTLAIQQEPMADDITQLKLVATGKLPVNDFIDDTLPVSVKNCTSQATGGTIVGDRDYYLIVCARDSAGHYTTPSNVVAVRPAAGSTNKITLTDIVWPTGTFAGYDVFAAIDDDQMICHQVSVTGALPASIEVTAPPDRSTWSLPSPNFRNLRIKVKKIPYVGVARITVGSVATNTIVCAETIGSDDWTGRDLTVVLFRGELTAPLLNFSVTDFDDDTGTFTVTPDPAAAGLEKGDVLAIRAMPPDECATTSIGDAKFQNVMNPGGLIAGAEIGNLVRVIAGAGRGQIRRISNNTVNTLTIDTPWETLPDETSRFIIEDPVWEYFAESNPTLNSDRTLETSIAATVSNQLDCDFLVQVVAVDTHGIESPDELSPIRSIYVNPDTGNPSGASGLSIVTHREDPNIPEGCMAFEFIPDNDNGSPITGVMAILSKALPAHGPYAAERAEHSDKIYETGTCRLTKGQRDVVVTRSADSSVLGKAYLIYSNDISPDSDLDCSFVETEGSNQIRLTTPFNRTGTFTYVIIEPWWPPNDTTNILMKWFPIEEMCAIGVKGKKLPINAWGEQGAEWRTPTINAPSGRSLLTLYSRNDYGLGTRLTYATPITVTYDGIVTTDTDVPSGCSGLVTLTNASDSTIPKGCMAFRINRDTLNYQSVYAVGVAMGASTPLHGPYATQRTAHPTDILASGTGAVIESGNVIVPVSISSPAPPGLAGYFFLILDGSGNPINAEGIKVHAADHLELTKGFFWDGTYDWVAIKLWWTLNQWDRIFMVPQDFKIASVEQAVWQTNPVPIFKGAQLYTQLYSINVWGLSK